MKPAKPIGDWEKEIAILFGRGFTMGGRLDGADSGANGWIPMNPLLAASFPVAGLTSVGIDAGFWGEELCDSN